MDNGHKPHRRSFVRALTGLAGLAGLGWLGELGASRPAAAQAHAALGAARGHCTVIDVDLCRGCGACVQACRQRNLPRVPLPELPIPQPSPSGLRVSDWSARREVADRLTPYNWLFIQSCVLSSPRGDHPVFLPRRCLHCENPQCVSLCPSGAARQSRSGATYVDHRICTGGGPCDSVCPWHIPQLQSGVGPYLRFAPRYVGRGMVFKCDFCVDLLEQGKPPVCVEACPHRAQHVGPRRAMLALAHKMAADRGGNLFGLEENGGTNTLYVSSVPFRDIEAAMLRQGQVGLGRPSLRPAGASMGKENSVLGVVLLAPLAGAALGWLRLWRDRQKERKP